MPRAVHAIAPQPGGALVAVGRNDGDIELMVPSENYSVLKRIPGKSGKHLQQALAWCAGDMGQHRLIGCGLDGFLFEADLTKLQLTNVRETYGGPAWSLAIAPHAPIAAVGCDDGAIKLFSLEGDGIEYARTFPTTGSRVLSVAWACDAQVVFAGSADSHIRAFAARSGQVLYHMAVEAYGTEPTMVWALCALSDGTLVSGDSLGHIQVWDIQTGTLRQSLATHEADVLALAVTSDEQVLFGAGVDSKVSAIERVEDENGVERWAFSHSHRPHTHDVRALACMEGGGEGGRGGDVLLSGGIDTKVCVYQAHNFKGRLTKLWPFPYHQLPDKAATAQRKGNDVKIEKLLKAILRLRQIDVRLKGDDHLACAALSPNGAYAAVSTVRGTRLITFPRSRPTATGAERIQAGSMAVPRIAAAPAHKLAFAPDGRRLVAAAAGGRLVVTEILEEGKARVKAHALRPPEGGDGGGHDEEPCAQLAISRDGQWVAAADTCGGLHVYSLDTLRHHWAVPRRQDKQRGAGLAGLDFQGLGSTLIMMHADSSVRAVDVEERRSLDWPRLQPVGDELYLGAAWDPARPDSVLLHSHRALRSLKHELAPKATETAAVTAPRQRSDHMRGKRKLGQSGAERLDGEGDAGVVERYRPILLAEFVDDGELVVVECPWLKVVAQLPDTLYRQRYAT
ncbi:quinon protein alcohol dehydrogenase-like superfamily [Tribonema minus]|uniref:Quinon protein alcohol dehydrogenase-like superfamily n=1 Tax=Tribonema minus TaxID=303371 RepID=A0A835YSL7_9STRA|nr:quinon protein alcohol dehydrogenase-like superfamily [Tribonema minus]